MATSKDAHALLRPHEFRFKGQDQLHAHRSVEDSRSAEGGSRASAKGTPVHVPNLLKTNSAARDSLFAIFIATDNV